MGAAGILVTGWDRDAGEPAVQLLRRRSRGDGGGRVGRCLVPAVIRREAWAAMRAVVARGDREVRVLSRHAGPGLFVGDLKTGAGLADALAGVTTVVHLATSFGGGDSRMTQNLLDAAQAAGVVHVVYVSIVGIDKITLGYYKEKLECERLVTVSPMPHTILRATQVHNLVATLFAAPAVLTRAVRSVDPDPADRGARRSERDWSSSWRASRLDGCADIGGPERLTGRQLADEWKRYRGSRRAVWPLKVAGRCLSCAGCGEQPRRWRAVRVRHVHRVSRVDGRADLSLIGAFIDSSTFVGVRKFIHR